ncbi:MAG: DUF4870 domain-containing protein [Fermentimonas sp.]|jgi:uncharacterized Tic20 family protein
MSYDDLRLLDELREKGSITEEEFQREKEKIFNQNNQRETRFVNKSLYGLSENTFLMLMHLSQLLGFVIPLAGFVVPLIMWTMNKEYNTNVDMHGKGIMNFIISYTIYVIALCITLIGIPLAIILLILSIIFIVVAGIKANNGEYWKYPLTIQFIK